MKITKSQLKQMIKEELQEGYGKEGSMAQSQLRRIAELANMIADEFDDSSNLEEWVEAKITKAQDYLSTVQNYLRGKADEKAAEEILSRRIGSYAGTTLPGGEKVPSYRGNPNKPWDALFPPKK